MKRFKNFSLLRWISVALIAGAVLLLVFQLVIFSRLRSSFSSGSKIAGVDVSGLNVDEAANRLTQAYSIPIELHFNDSSFQVKPAALGFSLDLSSMMAAADQSRASLPFWSAFWDYLFNKLPPSQDIPIRAQIDVTQMRSFLENEVASRYNQEPEPYSPIPGDVYFSAGKPGITLDVDRSIDLISMALKSPSDRVVNLTIQKSASSRPSLENLKIFLSQIIDVDGFTGVAEVYMLDLQNGQELQLAYQAGKSLPPDIAFSALSTIKIPIMIEVYRRKSEPMDDNTFTLLQKMVSLSDNDASDALMKTVMDPNFGPLDVTANLQNLGLDNTFLAGMFYTGAPLLKVYSTHANSRTDVNLDPDTFNQTTPAEMGSLLNDIYQCAQTGGGTFAAAIPGQISQNECRAMIALLSSDRIGWMIESGLPDGTQIAHKHGYAEDKKDGMIHSMCDAAIVYSPGGNYILTIYIHDFNQIVFDNGNKLYGDLSRAVYNYFNLGTQ
jgi:beta-lactamase class A